MIPVHRLMGAIFLALIFPHSICAAPPSPRHDALGDPLPPGALVRLGTERFRHRGHSLSVVYSPDGKSLYTSESLNGTKVGPMPMGVVRIWDPRSGKQVGVLKGQPFGSDTLVLSPDGKQLAVGSGASFFWVWDLEKRSPVCRIEWEGTETENQSNLLHAAFSPDGKTLATIGAGAPVCLWDAVTGKRRARFADNDGFRILYCLEGKCLAVAGRKALQVLDAATGKERWRLAAPEGGFHGLALSPAGKTLAVGGRDGSLRLVDAETGKVVRRWQGYQPSEKQPIRVDEVLFSPDGKTLVTTGSTEVKFWDATSGDQILTPGNQSGSSLAYSPDGKTLALNHWDEVGLIDPRTGKDYLPLPGHRSSVTALAFDPDGKSLHSCDTAGRALRWDLREARQTSSYKIGVESWPTVVYSPDGKRLVSASRDLTIDICDTRTGKVVQNLKGHGKELGPVVFSPDGKILASTGLDYTIRLWDLSTGKEAQRIEGGQVWRSVESLAFSPDGKILASGRRHGPIVLCEAATGKEIRRFPGYSQEACAVAFSPDGRILAVGIHYGGVGLWDIATGKELRFFATPTPHFPALAWAPDGRMIALAGPEGKVRILELATGREAMSLNGHGAQVRCIRYAPDGRTVATGSDDYTILVWDVTGLAAGGPRQEPPERTLKELWGAVAGSPGDATRAVWSLAAAPKQAVPFLKERLPPARRATPDELARLLADLDAERFADRQRATEALENQGQRAIPVLRAALVSQKGSAEFRRRASAILEALEGPELPPRQILEIRAVAVLEYAATGEARRLLESLAKGDPDARLTREAIATLGRLKRMPSPKP